MADLIKFPGKRQRPVAAYQLRRFGPDGSARPTVYILADCDADAREQARGLSDGLRAELWSSGRLLEHLESGDHPVVASIQLLGGSISPDPGCDSRLPLHIIDGGSDTMATEKQHGNREAKKPKKAVPKTNASAPSTKGTVSVGSKPGGRS